MEGEGIGRFCKEVSIGYIGSAVRKILTLEKYVEKELLADYYEGVEIVDINFERIKNQILQAIRKNKEDILYKNMDC